MPKRMLVNVLEPEECRIAIVDENGLDQLYVERSSATQLVGNIYKARVVNVEPSLGAAFVEFGGARNGFLHADDVMPALFHDQRLAQQVRDGRNPEAAPIAGMVKRGQDIIVQVIKEGIEKKAPKVTTFISLPGRYLVLMPNVKRRGVSRKIEDEEEREKLREMLASLNPPNDVGFIVRTAAAATMTRRELRKDMAYLLRLWGAIDKQARKSKAPVMLYQESDLVIRAVRDLFTSDISELLIDDEEEYRKVLGFMRITMPRQRKDVKLYAEPDPLFHRFGVEKEIRKVHERRVPLPGGGGIVIEQTEAMVAIDVNSGRYTREANIEETAYRTNMEAAKEIARQLRLRDLGGLIIGDFIDMEREEHKRDVEHALWLAMRSDRARTKMLRMSRFGLIEMTRQRMRASLRSSAYAACPLCEGSGAIKTKESMILDVLRSLRAAIRGHSGKVVTLTLHPQVAELLQNEKRQELMQLEQSGGNRIMVKGDGAFAVAKMDIDVSAGE